MLAFWILFHVIIIAILVLDLWVLNRESHELSTRDWQLVKSRSAC